MKQSKFDQLPEELQKEYLERGGKVEPDKSAPIDPNMRWNYKSLYSKSGKPKKNNSKKIK